MTRQPNSTRSTGRHTHTSIDNSEFEFYKWKFAKHIKNRYAKIGSKHKVLETV